MILLHDSTQTRRRARMHQRIAEQEEEAEEGAGGGLRQAVKKEEGWRGQESFEEAKEIWRNVSITPDSVAKQPGGLLFSWKHGR